MKEQEISQNLPLHDMTQLEADSYCSVQSEIEN